jgi:hypothetical protein
MKVAAFIYLRTHPILDRSDKKFMDLLQNNLKEATAAPSKKWLNTSRWGVN